MITRTRILALFAAFAVIMTAPAFLGVLTAEDGPIAKIDSVVNGTETETTSTRLGPIPETPTRVRFHMSLGNMILLNNINGDWLNDTTGPSTTTVAYPPTYNNNPDSFYTVSISNCNGCPWHAQTARVSAVNLPSGGYVLVSAALEENTFPQSPPSGGWVASPLTNHTERSTTTSYRSSYTLLYDRPTISTTTTTTTGGMRDHWFHPLMAMMVDLLPIGIYLNIGFALIALWKVGSPNNSSSKSDTPTGFSSGTF